MKTTEKLNKDVSVQSLTMMARSGIGRKTQEGKFVFKTTRYRENTRKFLGPA